MEEQRSAIEIGHNNPPSNVSGFSCPLCGNRMRTVYTRVSRADKLHEEGLRRRRECTSCKHRITTREIADETLSNLRTKEAALIWLLQELSGTIGNALRITRKVSEKETGLSLMELALKAKKKLQGYV